jgi:bifunctional DNase/RNase
MLDTHKDHIKIIAMDNYYVSIRITSSTDKVYEMLLERASFFRWMEGDLIQNCFPDFDVEIRELMISGMDPEMQAEIFGYHDEEES